MPPSSILSITRHETFTFTPDDGTPAITIYSGELRKWLHAAVPDKVIDLHFPPNETEAELIGQHGLEAPRMASMTEEEAKEPVIIGLCEGGTHILIDGGHRRWFWSKRGVNTLRGWAVPEAIWRTFLATPEDLLHSYHHPDGSLLPHRQPK